MKENTPQVSIIVPTFREAENLPELVPRVFSVLSESAISGEIVIVDDASPDSTIEVCEQLSQRYAVRLLTRDNVRGLATAVVHGINNARGEFLIVMDADLSHPPEAIPALIAELRRPEVDFVIGSRYVTGGAIDSDWGLYRSLNSKLATLLARPLIKARDPLAGFFAVRRKHVAFRTDLDPIGYKIALELMVRCGCRQPREIPIAFNDRRAGESKLSISEQLNYLRHLGRLYRYRFLGLKTIQPHTHFERDRSETFGLD